MNESPKSSKSQRIRDELWTTFFHEMDDLLERLESQLLDIEKNIHSEDLIAGLFRTMHTLKGTAGMMGLSNVETLAHKAEDIIDLVRAHERELNPQIIDLMFSTLDSLKVAQAIIVDTRQDVQGDQNTDLIEALKAQALTNTPSSEHAYTNDVVVPVDTSIWQQVNQECRELLDQIEAAALALEKGQQTSVDQLFRALHSLKSAVDFAHLINATHLIHNCEDLIGLLRDQSTQLPTGVIDIVLAVTDLMRPMFNKSSLDKDINENVNIVTQDLSLTVIQPLLEKIHNLLVVLQKNQESTTPLTEVTTESNGILLRKSTDYPVGVDDIYWQNYFFLVNENLQAINKALKEADNQLIQDYLQEMLFASKQLQINSAIEALQVISVTDAASLKKLQDFFNQLEQQLPSGFSDQPGQELIEIESFFDIIWKILSSLRKVAQVNPINAELLQNEINRLQQYCHNVEPLDIENNLQLWTIVLQDQPLDPIKISSLINELYTYFWDQEDQCNQVNGSVLRRTLNITEAVDSADKTVVQLVPAENFASVVPLELNKTAESWATQHDELPEAIFIIDFLENIQLKLAEIQQYHQQFAATQQLPPDWFTCIQELAQQSLALGFNNLSGLLNKILQAAQHTQLSVEDLFIFEQNLFGELCRVSEALPEGRRNELAEIANLTSIFKRWHSENCFQELALFINHLNELQPLTADNPPAEQRLHAMQRHLQSLLFSCQYWQLEQCEQAVLLLIDLLHRTQMETIHLTGGLIQEILQLSQALGQCFDEILTRGDCNQSQIATWISQFNQSIQAPHAAQQILMARSFFQSLRLPACLNSALQEEEYAKIGTAIMRQEYLFLLYTDIEDNEALVGDFFNLLADPKLNVITSATDYVETRSVFYFLLVSNLGTQYLTQALQKLDPSQKRLALTPLILNPVVSNKEPVDTGSLKSVAPNSFDQKDLHDLELLQQALGQLVSIKTHMLQSSEVIKKLHLTEDVLSYMQPILPAGEALPVELQDYLHEFNEVIDQWTQSQEALNTVADQLQDSIKNLQQTPLQPLLKRMDNWFKQQWLQLTNCNELSTSRQLILPDQTDTIQSVMINKLQLSLLETGLQQIISAYLSNATLTADISITLQVQVVEQSTRFLVIFSPPLALENGESLDLADLQQQLVEKNIRLQLQVEAQKLTSVQLILQDNHRIIEGLIVSADQLYYVIPTHMITRLVNRHDVELMCVSAAESVQMLKIEQKLLPLSLFPQQKLIGTHNLQTENISNHKQSIVLVIEQENQKYALLIDELLGFQQVVVTPLQGQLQQCRGFSGCCVLGKDKVAMVFDAVVEMQDAL